MGREDERREGGEIGEDLDEWEQQVLVRGEGEPGWVGHGAYLEARCELEGR